MSCVRPSRRCTAGRISTTVMNIKDTYPQDTSIFSLPDFVPFNCDGRGSPICCRPILSYSASPHGDTGLCDDRIKHNTGESQYSTRSMVLIKA
ncbi:hypothetical protein J6590_004328 [Homalodisca vitripennis]|nr:hypothetical protein J6590_004328 [Homalodisca vitripennis]